MCLNFFLFEDIVVNYEQTGHFFNSFCLWQLDKHFALW